MPPRGRGETAIQAIRSAPCPRPTIGATGIGEHLIRHIACHRETVLYTGETGSITISEMSQPKRAMETQIE